MLFLLLFFLFILGLVVGSFLNVCIYRIPWEKSILWPGSHCGHCFQPIRWYDNLPLLSYLLLRGRCRSCGTSYSMRYFFVELFTGLSFAGLFYLEIIGNVHHFDALKGEEAWIALHLLPGPQAWMIFGFHALLVSFLIAASFCDLDHREIPLPITISGTVVGLIGSALWPWPWPYSPAQAPQQPPGGLLWWQVGPNLGPVEGLYPWPFWLPLPAWFAPGTWQTGLATGVAGLLLGTLLLRAIRFLFSTGLGVEALGLGDADLMMMAGSFLGWQAVVVAFFMGAMVGLFFGILQIVVRGDNKLAFGPSLALGTVLTMLAWHSIGPQFLALFFNAWLMLPLAVVGSILMLAISYFLRISRLMREPVPEGPEVRGQKSEVGDQKSEPDPPVFPDL